MAQSNATFNALDTLTVAVHAVRKPVGYDGVKMKGRPLSMMAHLKRSITELKAGANYLAHALILAIAKVTNDPDSKVYIRLETAGTRLTKGAGIPEHERFQTHFREYKIVVYEGPYCDST